MSKPRFTMKKVKSSAFTECGHCPETNTLAVQFKSGGVHHFHGVSTDDFEAMMDSDSVGKHFHANIRGKFESSKR